MRLNKCIKITFSFLRLSPWNLLGGGTRVNAGIKNLKFLIFLLTIGEGEKKKNKIIYGEFDPGSG